MGNLLLYDRVTNSDAFLGNITHLAQDWQRSTWRVGGYYLGSFQVGEITSVRLAGYFDQWLGQRLTEKTLGMTSWEGIIYEMRLVLDGIEYIRTLDPDYWHNKVKVVYSSDIGDREEIAWSENTDSSDEYGEAQQIITLAGATSAAATALQGRSLLAFAWPRSRMAGGMLRPGARAAQRESDGLYVTVAGYWATLNWRYREATISDTAYNSVVTLVGASEFVSIGRAEANSMDLLLDCEPIAQRLGDLLEDTIGHGDASGNVWQGGVYADRKFVYEQAPTTVTHFLRDGQLVNAAGVPVVPELVEPGFLLKNASAPTGGQPPGVSSLWDDPQVSYVDEVEFIAPDELRLRLHGVEETLLVLEAQIRGAPG